MKNINRRRFLILSAGTTGGILLARHFTGQAASRTKAVLATARTGESTSLIQSQNGLLEFSLQANTNRYNLAGQQGVLMSYNGQIPGPRIEARPGDTVRIQFTNRLSQPTNLHYHGLHVSPAGNADNIFLSIPPDEALTYEFTIPADHSAGTFYYHPHLHGSVAEQVFAGLGGIFVVRGPLDEIPEVRAAQEEFLFLKDFAFNANGEIPVPNHMDVMQGREGSLLTVNGEVNPNFSIAAGGLLRLRIVNASASRFYRLALEDHPFYLIATDGGAIAQPVELKELLLTPGERAEVLVKGDRQPGQYRLLNLPYNRSGIGMMGRMPEMSSENSPTSIPQTLATISYQGSVLPLALPRQLIPVETLPDPVKTRRIELSMGMMSSGMQMNHGSSMSSGMGGMRMVFLFNGQSFDANRIDAAVQLGTVEDWELVNVDPDGMEHPFHLHVDPFQVVSRNGQPEPYRAWKDTVRVGKDETVRIRIPFRNFPGKTVYHCHVLDHEDLGMMGMIEMRM